MLDTFKIPKLKGRNYNIQSIRIHPIIIEKGYTNYIASNSATYIDNTETLNKEALKTTIIIKLALEDSSLL